MQAAARSAVLELVRGVSTGITLWAGCPTPVCECHNHCVPPAPADCICHGDRRAPTSVQGIGAVTFVAFLLSTACLAFGAGYLCGRLRHGSVEPQRNGAEAREQLRPAIEQGIPLAGAIDLGSERLVVRRGRSVVAS